MLERLADNAQLFLLIFVRIIAMIQIAPLLSSTNVPQVAKAGLAFLSALLIFPWVQDAGYPVPEIGLAYLLLLVGEVLLGIILGFFLVVIYAAFQVSGQFFSLQMGFGASQVFDPEAQVQIPLMGQLLNLVALFIFVHVSGLQKLFLSGVYKSFQAITAVDIVLQKDYLFRFMMGALGRLFEQALLIAFPILGTLFLVQVTMGLLSKASPQMNLLLLGFPLSIGIAFLIIFITLPFIIEAFERIIDTSFLQIMRFLDHAQGAAP